jgi:lipopolysaccharide export system protein LptA
MNALRASALALLLALFALPAGVQARSSDRSKPMDISADETDYVLDDRRPTVLTGNVTITQGTLDIRARRAEITQRGGEPTRAVLTGSPVKLDQQLDDGTPMSATANKVDYDLTTEIVVLSGNVILRQPRGSLSGGRVVYNMRTGQVQSGGKGEGRVKMRILPRNARDAD